MVASTTAQHSSDRIRRRGQKAGTRNPAKRICAAAAGGGGGGCSSPSRECSQTTAAALELPGWARLSRATMASPACMVSNRWCTGRHRHSCAPGRPPLRPPSPTQQQPEDRRAFARRARGCSIVGATDPFDRFVGVTCTHVQPVGSLLWRRAPFPQNDPPWVFRPLISFTARAANCRKGEMGSTNFFIYFWGCRPRLVRCSLEHQQRSADLLQIISTTIIIVVLP